MSCALGFVCDSQAKIYTIIHPGIKQHVILVVQTPHSSFCLVIEWLPTRLKLQYHRILHSTNSLKYNSWGTLCISHWVHHQMPSFVEMRSSGVFPLGRVHRTMNIPKKGWRLDHGDLKQRNEDINERDQPLRKGTQDREDSLGFSLPTPSPLYSTA